MTTFSNELDIEVLFVDSLCPSLFTLICTYILLRTLVFARTFFVPDNVFVMTDQHCIHMFSPLYVHIHS